MRPPRYRGAVLRKSIPTEASVEVRVVKTYEACGCRVYKLSGNSRKGGTRQTPGLPDLYIVPPAPRAPWWHETKRPKGRVRPEQAEFRRECIARDMGHVLGGVEEAEQQLLEQGLAHRVGTFVLALPAFARREPEPPPGTVID